jgi:hypothetical protein
MQYVVLFGDDGAIRAYEIGAFLRAASFPEFAGQGADALRLTLTADALGLRVAQVAEMRLLFDAAGRQDPARLAAARAALESLNTVERLMLDFLPDDALDGRQRQALDARCELDAEDYVRALVAALGYERFAAEIDDLEALEGALDELGADDDALDGFGREVAAASRDELVNLVFDLFYRPACDAAPKQANRLS